MFRASERLRGMAFGSLFLSLFGALWMVLALNAESLLWLVFCVLLPLSLLLMRTIGLFLASGEADRSEPPLSDEERLAGRRLRRQFGLVFAIEFGAIAIAANWLSASGHADWIVAVVGIIVGLHFLPLARVFRYQVYYVTGAFEVLFCGLIAWGMRQHLDAADPFFGLVMGLSLWLTALVVLMSAGRLSRQLPRAAQ